MKKTLTIKIDHLTKNGVGVTRIEKKPLYIPNVIEDEEILATVQFEGKRNIFATVKKVLKPSKDRTNPKCDVYYQCGGCHLSIMNYKKQLEFKKNIVEKLYKAKGFDVTIHDCVGMKHPYNYRNKVQTPVGKINNRLVAGFYKENTHEIVPFNFCHVQDDISNQIIESVLKAMKDNKIEPYDEDLRKGIVRHLLVRRANEQSMLTIITSQDSFPGRNNFVKSIIKYLPHLTTIVQNINPRATNVILGEKEKVLYGKGYIVDNLCGINFKISSKSFYQINKIQTEKLYNKAIELASLKPTDIILDAYCGIGTIGLIAAHKVKHVIGVEIVKEAIIDAKNNALNNNIKNCDFYCDDAKEFIKNVDFTFDVVFVDPPRKGCDQSFLKSLIAHKPKKIVYISCNPETQVENVKFLCDNGYEFSDVYPFDMFPQTSHVETIVALSLKNSLSFLN